MGLVSVVVERFPIGPRHLPRGECSGPDAWRGVSFPLNETLWVPGSRPSDVSGDDATAKRRDALPGAAGLAAEPVDVPDLAAIAAREVHADHQGVAPVGRDDIARYRAGNDAAVQRLKSQCHSSHGGSLPGSWFLAPGRQYGTAGGNLMAGAGPF